MKAIISPAKKMREACDILPYQNLPYFVEETEKLLNQMRAMSFLELKKLWKCNDTIAKLNYERIRSMNLYSNLTPAIAAYDGIQYQYMAPTVMETEELKYLEEHVRIISGFYGILRPFDGVVPYRLEMQAKWNYEGKTSLYDFWDQKIVNQLIKENDCILNLASKEYSHSITRYNKKNICLLTCVFGEYKNGKIVEKGTRVKMARGEMIKFLAENRIENIEEIKHFNHLGYQYEDKLSERDRYVFIKKEV